MPFIKVKNKHNTKDKVPEGYDCWLDFWEDKKGYSATTCERYGCSETKNLVGAHVIKSGEGAKEYIMPLCKGAECNHYTNEDEFEAWESDLVPVHDE